MHKILASAATAVFMLLASASFSAANAKGFISRGDELFEVAPLSGADGVVLGSLCQHFGIIGADIWTWDCRLVLTDKNLKSYSEVPTGSHSEIKTLYSTSDAKRSLWNRFGILAIAGLLIAAILADKLKKKREA